MKIDARPHPIFTAILLMAICLLPVMALKDISPSNELRYLSIADEALENGNVFTFSNQGEPYADKPPLYLWLLMLSRLVFGGHSTFVLSLFSFIPAMVTIAVMDRWLMLVSRQTSLKFSWNCRFSAALMLGTSMMFLGTSLILRMDMLMTMFIVLSLFTFYKMYREIGSPGAEGIMLPVYIFLALFTKGPVGILMPVLSIFFFLLFSGKIRSAGRYLGLRTWLILAFLCSLWFLAVWLEGGKEYLDNLLFHQTVDRAIDAFHHKKPVWYYFTAIWYVAAPYSLGLVYAMFSRAGRQGYVTDAGRLFFTAATVTFIMLSLFSSKLSVYLLPIVPFMVYHAVLAGKNTGCNGWMKFSFTVPSLIFILAALAVFAFPLYGDRLPMVSLPEDVVSAVRSPYAYAAASILLIGSVLSVRALFSRKSWTRSASCLALSMLAAVMVLTPLVPGLNNRLGYRNLAAVARELKEISHVSGYASVGVSRAENMDVYLGEDVAVLDVDTLDEDIPEIQDAVLMVRTSFLDKEPLLGKRLSGLHGVVVGDYTVFIVPGPGGLAD